MIFITTVRAVLLSCWLPEAWEEPVAASPGEKAFLNFRCEGQYFMRSVTQRRMNEAKLGIPENIADIDAALDDFARLRLVVERQDRGRGLGDDFAD